MAVISLIAALDEANGLGINNQLLTHLPADLHYFKNITMGKPIIMGRKTYESIGRPLPGRHNIILSQSLNSIAGISVVSSLNKALELAGDVPEIIIIGGAQIFAESMSHVTRLYITRIHHTFTSDVFFPKINEAIWRCVNKQFRSCDEKNPYDMTFYTYERAIHQ
jgi:dihydrofolate reductase